jgi:transglutaminase-like putative cysteine protease
MTLARAFRTVVVAHAALAGFSFAVAERESAIAWLIPVVALVNHATFERGVAREPPRWAVYAAATLALLFSVAQFWTAGLNVTTFCEFLGLILLVKLWDRRLARDYSQLITLSVFLQIGSILQSQALVSGVLALAQVPLLIAAVMLYQIYAAAERVASTRAGRPREPTDDFPARSRRDLAFTTAAVLVAGLGVGVGVFLGMPRGVGAGAFGPVIAPAARNVTGFTERVELRRGGFISESREPVLDLEVRDGQGNILGGPGNFFYLRGVTLSEYHAGTWRAAPLPEVRAHQDFIGAPIELPKPASGRTLVQFIRLRQASGGEFPLFALLTPTSVRFEEPVRLSYRPGDMALSIRGRNRAGPLLYSVTSVEPTIRTGTWGRTPGVYFESAAVRALAEEIVRAADLEPDPARRDMEDDRLVAGVLESHLRRRFAYTLDKSAPPPTRDPIEWFLTEERRGNCEYFASAHAALCRSLGVNARVVAGYLAAEFEPDIGLYRVRQANAHAWTEVEVAPGVWQTFDPTPPADLATQHQPRRTLLARLGMLFDSIEYAWADSVVGYDRSRQSRMFDPASSLLRARGRLGDLAERVRGGAGEELTRRLGLGAAALVALIVLAVALAALRRRAPRRGMSRRRTPAGPLPHYYRNLLRALARAGLAKPESVPPLAHVRAALADNPQAADAAERVVLLLYRQRFGGEDASDSDVRRARLDVRAVARAR